MNSNFMWSFLQLSWSGNYQIEIKINNPTFSENAPNKKRTKDFMQAAQ